MPTTVIAAEAISGIAVDTSVERAMAATGPTTQIISWAVVSSAKSARTPSRGSICGYNARTTGIRGGTDAPTSRPSAINGGPEKVASASPSMLAPLTAAQIASVAVVRSPRPAMREVSGMAIASPTVRQATTTPAVA